MPFSQEFWTTRVKSGGEILAQTRGTWVTLLISLLKPTVVLTL